METVTKKEYHKALKIVHAYHNQIAAEYEYVKIQKEKIPNIGMTENTILNELDISMRLYNNLYRMIEKHTGYGHDHNNPNAEYIDIGKMTIIEIRDLVNYKEFQNQRHCGKKTWDEYLRVISTIGL